MQMNRRTMLALSGASAVTFTANLARASSGWSPEKPVEFIIMAGVGGGADKMARLMQSIVESGDMSPRPLIPDNKPGGTGAEALVYLNQTNDPDHVVMVTLNSFFTTPLRQPGLDVDIMSFAPVARMAEDTFLLWVHKDEGITSFEQFLSAAKDRGSDWVMGGTGTASEDNIITDFLNNNFGLEIKYIPYKGGGAVAKELAGRQITSSVNNPSEALGFYESGDVIPLVAFTDERLSMFPDVPTLKETGTDFAYFMQRSVVGAPGMKPEALAYYTGLFQGVYDSAQWQEYKSAKSLLGEFMAGDELLAYWDVQRTRHEEILKAAGQI